MICPGESRACRDGTPEEASRKHVRQVEADSGKRPDLMSSQEREGIPRLRKENYEPRRANEILKSASVSFVSVDARPGTCAKRRPPRRRSSQGARVFGGWRSASAAGGA
jgi:transposase-like protein